MIFLLQNLKVQIYFLVKTLSHRNYLVQKLSREKFFSTDPLRKELF